MDGLAIANYTPPTRQTIKSINKIIQTIECCFIPQQGTALNGLVHGQKRHKQFKTLFPMYHTIEKRFFSESNAQHNT